MLKTYWHNETETKQMAERLARLVKAEDIICLDGDLGAGKTTFTRYFAHALGITAKIKSPTFTIVREYEDGRLPLYHMDAYRLEETGAFDMGLEEYFEGDGVSIIEWPIYIEEELGANYLWIKLKATDATTRELTFEPHGERAEKLTQALLEGEEE
ncbi:MAG: tRNA (adenosine(37)-N6)-threonylcarbamoyltransferase complex ATPase subunit type 1 TsaE [Aerococcus sp.]|nr:tRNA (adenosine(37)-N6)-threonylcarbamoyltransferase complex ATPase subunit type 1 TsaE [Aerococcus sp.]